MPGTPSKNLGNPAISGPAWVHCRETLQSSYADLPDGHLAPLQGHPPGRRPVPTSRRHLRRSAFPLSHRRQGERATRLGELHGSWRGPGVGAGGVGDAVPAGVLTAAPDAPVVRPTALERLIRARARTTARPAFTRHIGGLPAFSLMATPDRAGTSTFRRRRRLNADSLLGPVHPTPRDGLTAGGTIKGAGTPPRFRLTRRRCAMRFAPSRQSPSDVGPSASGCEGAHRTAVLDEEAVEVRAHDHVGATGAGVVSIRLDPRC